MNHQGTWNQKLHQQLIETQHDFHLTPEHVLAAVQTGLAVAEKPALKPTKLDGAPDGSVFKMPELTGTWGDCVKGLQHPYTKQVRPITFDHEVAKILGDKVVLVHLNHRLVQMCLRLLRSKVWEQDDKLHRVTIRSLPKEQTDGVVALVVSRLVITGGNHHRLHEEIIYSGGYLKDGSFSRERGVNVINDWLEKSISAQAPGSLKDALSSRFETHSNAIQQTIEARSKERLKGLESTLERRKDQEISDITAVLSELEKSISAELNSVDEPEQFELFQPDERTQVRRNVEALKARLARIPEEKELEIKTIEHRYEGYMDRTFPVAVIFLVPDNLAESK